MSPSFPIPLDFPSLSTLLSLFPQYISYVPSNPLSLCPLFLFSSSYYSLSCNYQSSPFPLHCLSLIAHISNTPSLLPSHQPLFFHIKYPLNTNAHPHTPCFFLTAVIPFLPFHTITLIHSTIGMGDRGSRSSRKIPSNDST